MGKAAGVTTTQNEQQGQAVLLQEGLLVQKKTKFAGLDGFLLSKFFEQ